MLRNDHFRYDRVLISDAHELSNIRSVVPFTVPDGTDVLAAVWRPPQSDVVLKCLHRDDPLRHAYLRRRWRAT
jgi:hypothetical protein